MISKREIIVGDKHYTIIDDAFTKTCIGPNYNYNFMKDTGFFARWGRYKKHNPSFSPIGPELLDVEITTSCDGVNGQPCAFCYKNNTTKGNWMSLKIFKKIFKKLPASVCQIAFGVDSHCITNPDCWEIFHHARNHGIIPNVTVAQIDNETAGELARVMGAVSVTAHDDKSICYQAVNYLAEQALKTKILKQINIHVMVAKETEKLAYDVLSDSTNMRYVNSVVLLALKQKGRGEGFTPLSENEFGKIVKYAFKVGAKMGFDSCHCHKFLECVKDHPQYESFKMVAEPCESGCFSLYVDVHGRATFCSFLEDVDNIPLFDILDCNDFLKDIWYHEKAIKFRRRLIRGKRECPIYNI